MSDIDCKNCISYAICRASMIEYLYNAIVFGKQENVLNSMLNHASDLYIGAYTYNVSGKCNVIYEEYNMKKECNAECSVILMSIFDLPTLRDILDKIENEM